MSARDAAFDVHPAQWWHRLDDGRIQCDLCPRDCRLHDGQRGLCFVRARQGDAMVLTTFRADGSLPLDPETDRFQDEANALAPGDVVTLPLAKARATGLEFENSGVNVITPAVAYYVGPLMFYLRYYYAIDDDSDIDPSNSVYGKIALTVIDKIILSAGAGAGDRTDWLDVTDANVDNYWLVTGGLGVQFNWQHGVYFDYIYRNETSENDRIDVDFRQHQFLLTYQLRF